MCRCGLVGALGSVGLMVEPDHLKGVFQPKQFCDSTILSKLNVLTETFHKF